MVRAVLDVCVVRAAENVLAVRNAAVVGAVTCVHTYTCGIPRRQEYVRADALCTGRYVHVRMCDVKVMFLNVQLTQTFRRQRCVGRSFGDYRSHKLLDLSSTRTQIKSVPT